MEINRIKMDTKYQFKDLELGTIFMTSSDINNGTIYMKTDIVEDGYYSCVALEYGEINYFAGDTIVFPLEATLSVSKYKIGE